MCIICAKPAGIDIPIEDTFDSCFTSNRDGIGFAYALPGQEPTISKGFVNVKKLMNMLKTHEVTKEHNLIVHFRFATHGKKDQGNCHPFPLSPSFDDMRLLHCTCQVAIAHNGVFSGMPQHNDHSDTMKFVSGVLASPEVVHNLDSKAVKELIRGYCGYSSKLAFLRPQGLSLIGDFETENGVYYSNSQYKKWGYTTRNYEKDKDGKSWCYKHNTHDCCTWCSTHKQYDTCEYVESWKNRFKEDKPILLEHCGSECDKPQRQCLWCTTTEGVKFDKEADGFLCDYCAGVLANGNRVDY